MQPNTAYYSLWGIVTGQTLNYKAECLIPFLSYVCAHDEPNQLPICASCSSVGTGQAWMLQHCHGKIINNHRHYPPAPITAAIIVAVEATSRACTMDILHSESNHCIILNNSSQIAWITMKKHIKTKMILIKIIKTKTMNMWVKATKSSKEINIKRNLSLNLITIQMCQHFQRT